MLQRNPLKLKINIWLLLLYTLICGLFILVLSTQFLSDSEAIPPTPQTIIPYTLLMQLKRPALFLKPLTPFDQYQQQMNALPEAITAMTGLPLYDLRNTSNV